MTGNLLVYHYDVAMCSLPVVSCVSSQLVEVEVPQDSVFHRSKCPSARSLASDVVFAERKQDLAMASCAGVVCANVTYAIYTV